MSKLNENVQMPTGTPAPLAKVLYDLFQATARKVNGLASGVFSAVDEKRASVPTTGTWAKGDFVRNSAPVEAGAPLAKYVLVGWLRVTDGSANVLNTDWLECRFLTGN